MTIKPLLRATVIALSTALASAIALAQEKRAVAPGYPSKPIRVLVTVTAGGGLDFITRAVSAKVSERLLFPLIVDNVSGANGAIAVNTTITSAPDGHTLLSTGGSTAINAVFNKFDRDIRQALAPVAQMSTQPYVLYVSAASPLNSTQELIALAKRNPGKLNYGSTGVASVIHLGTELIEFAAGVDMVHVPYKGSAAALVDLTSGRLDFLVNSVVPGAQMVRAGKLKALAVTGLQRMPEFPGTPTLAESVFPGYELTNTYTLYTNGATPAAILNAMNREVAQALTDPELRKKMTADASIPAEPRTPDELRKILIAEIERWETVVKKANIKLEE